MRSADQADQTGEVQIKQIKQESYRICRRNADQSEQTFIIFLRHHDRKAIYLIDLLKPLAGLTGVDLWKSLPDVAAIAAARSWFALSKEERAAYIDEATRLSLASGARHARQEMAKNQDYVRSVYWQKLPRIDPVPSSFFGLLRNKKTTKMTKRFSPKKCSSIASVASIYLSLSLSN
ncbi:uncharacterized protein LOC108819387 isoform X2 [Raphanus sativus]|uniref:Uncharacterized protein LOC108819387 isoform X2 n=1 Tax=Raphanus sativus TaxID=3726 RepID=A0A9W3CC91_RAPSA|nr:uncharacterized protein LOC108819387 isoform X2 [Raphanus sativus]